MNHSKINKSHKKETRKRALTDLPLPRLVEEPSYCGMELEDDESYHGLSNNKGELFSSPDASFNSKNHLNTTCTTKHTSKNRFWNTTAKTQEEFMDNLYFENTLLKFNNFSLSNVLERHEVNEKLRGKMMDWMIEVLKIYKQKEETLFRAFLILDMYLACRKTPLKNADLHLIGTCCMCIASKQEEISQIRLNAFYEDICKQKFSKEMLCDTQSEILLTIGFRTQFPTMLELVRCGMRLLDIDDREISLFLESISFLICKMSLFSLEMIKKYTYPQLVAGSLILSLKLVENLKSYFPSDPHVL